MTIDHEIEKDYFYANTFDQSWPVLYIEHGWTMIILLFNTMDCYTIDCYTINLFSELSLLSISRLLLILSSPHSKTTNIQKIKSTLVSLFSVLSSHNRYIFWLVISELARVMKGYILW